MILDKITWNVVDQLVPLIAAPSMFEAGCHHPPIPNQADETDVASCRAISKCDSEAGKFLATLLLSLLWDSVLLYWDAPEANVSIV